MWHWGARLYLWACRRLYNEFAWTYDWVSGLVSLGHWWGWRLAALDHVRAPFALDRDTDLVTGLRVLEVGFGTGDLLIEMARRGWDVWGLDLSPAMQRITARKLRQRGLWVPRTRARAQQLPFPDDAFDAIVSTFPAEFIIQLPALREFARVLRSPEPAEGRPGGRLVVAGASVVVNHPALRKAFQLIFGSAVADGRLGLSERIAQAGLRVTVVERPGRFASPQIIIAEKVGPPQSNLEAPTSSLLDADHAEDSRVSASKARDREIEGDFHSENQRAGADRPERQPHRPGDRARDPIAGQRRAGGAPGAGCGHQLH